MISYLKRLAAGAILLFLGLFGGLFSLFDPFDLTADAPLLLGICALAALGVAAIHALPNGRTHLLFTLALWLFLLGVLWWDWERVFAGGQVIFHQISLVYHRQLSFVLFYELPGQLAGASPQLLAQLSTRFLALALSFLSAWLGAWLLRGWPVWLGAVSVCCLPGISLFVLLQPHPLPLFAVLLFLALVVLSRRGYLTSLDLGARRVLIGVGPVCLVMALLYALFPAASYERPSGIEALRQSIQRMDLPLSSTGLAGGGQVLPGELPFPRYSAPSYDGHTVLTVESGGFGGTRLLRGYSAGVYTASGWEGLPDDAYLDAPALPRTAPYSYPVLSTCPDSPPISLELVITDVASGGPYYYVPYFPLSMPQQAVYAQDAYLTRPTGIHSYAFSYLPQGATPLQRTLSPQGEEAYRRWVYDHYLDMPYSLLTQDALEVIREAAAHGEDRGAHSTAAQQDLRHLRIEQAEAVADYLRSFTHYDQSAATASAGEDLLSYFLTQSHRGYCVHYATAATLIFREMGIPARLAGGYMVRLSDQSRTVEVPDRNAHAWVEIYVDGFGWQPADVTPGFSGDVPVDSPATQAPVSPSPTPSPGPSPTAPAPSSPSPTPGALPPSDPSGATPAGSDGPGPILGALPWLLALAGSVAALLLQRALRLRRRKGLCTQNDPNAAVLQLYRYLTAVQSHGGVPVPPEALALAQKAAFSQHTLTPGERRAMEGHGQRALEAVQRAPLLRRLVLKYLWALC